MRGSYNQASCILDQLFFTHQIPGNKSDIIIKTSILATILPSLQHCSLKVNIVRLEVSTAA